MEFPVDILVTMDPGSLEQSAKSYMSKRLCKNSDIPDYLSVPGSRKVEISLSKVSFVPLYGADIKEKILAVFSPEEPFKAVGLYLLDRWWSAEDILKTADSSRTGLIQVRTPGERIVLYVLNRIVYRTEEMSVDDVPFPCHGEDEIAKILWKNGEAIGFYSVKPEETGRLSNSFLIQRYQLPVMDTIFIRKCHRGHGYGLHMLKDFVNSFKKDFMGLSYPLSPAMYKVCKKYLSLYPEDTELLWEIAGVGSPFQKDRKIQATDPKENDQVLGDFHTKVTYRPKKVELTQAQKTMEFIKVVEEVVQIKTTKDTQDTQAKVLDRSSRLKRKKLGAEKGETLKKILRVRDIDPDVQCAEDDPVQEDGKFYLHLKESEIKDTIKTTTHDPGHPITDITHLQEQNKLSPESSHQSEKESLSSNDPFEHQQVVEVEIVKMSSETEEVNKKSVEFKALTNDADKMFLNVRETSEGIVDRQKNKTDLEKKTNKEDLVNVGKIFVVENIVDDTEEMEGENNEAGVLEVSFMEKEKSEQVKEKLAVEEIDSVQLSLQEPEEQEPSPTNEQEKIKTIQQEEDPNLAFSLKWKQGKQRSNYQTSPRCGRTQHDQDVESELGERGLQSSAKKTIKATFKQMHFKSKSIKQPELLKDVERLTEKELKRTKSQAELMKKERVEENAERENVKVYNTKLIVAHQENEEEIDIINDCIDQQTNLMEVHNNMKDGSQDKATTARKTTEDHEQISQFEETGKMVASEKVMVLNDEERVPESVVTDKKIMEEVQKETDTAQEIPGEITQSLHLFKSSENDECDRSDVLINLDEEDETSLVTPLRRSKRLKDQTAEGEQTKSVSRRSVRLSNKATPQRRSKQVAVGKRMELETVHVFSDGDPGNRILFVQSTCEEGEHVDIPEQDKMSSLDIIHGETEQICISEEESAADNELSVLVNSVKNKSQKTAMLGEMVHKEDSMESTSTLTPQEASVVLEDVVNVHPVRKRKDKKETVATVDHSLITHDEQDDDIHTEKKIHLEVTKASTSKDQTTLQSDNVQESPEDISVCTSRNLRRRTLPVTPTPERKSRRLQNIFSKTKVRKNTEEEISDEEAESVFTRYLRGRIVTVTPRRRSKHFTIMEKARTAEEEVHGMDLKNIKLLQSPM